MKREQSGLLSVLGIIMFLALAIFGFWLDYQWKKMIVRDAIRESQSQPKGD